MSEERPSFCQPKFLVFIDFCLGSFYLWKVLKYGIMKYNAPCTAYWYENSCFHMLNQFL